MTYARLTIKANHINAKLTIKANGNEEWRRDEFYHLKWNKNEHRWEVSSILEYDAGNREILPLSEIFYMWNVQVYLEATLKLRKQCCSFKATMPFLEYRFGNNLTINLLTVRNIWGFFFTKDVGNLLFNIVDSVKTYIQASFFRNISFRSILQIRLFFNL